MVTEDSQEGVLIFRYTQTLHHNIYIITIMIIITIKDEAVELCAPTRIIPDQTGHCLAPPALLRPSIKERKKREREQWAAPTVTSTIFFWKLCHILCPFTCSVLIFTLFYSAATSQHKAKRLHPSERFLPGRAKSDFEKHHQSQPAEHGWIIRLILFCPTLALCELLHI